MDCHIDWAGQSVVLVPEPALWWPTERVLFVADLHLGKAATYRALGQPVPGGTTRENLARLDALLARLDPRRLVFLGDFLHGQVAQQRATMDAVQAWRAQHAALPMTLVRGNHDRRAGDPPLALNIGVVSEPHLLGPFAACHLPQEHASHAVLAGHVHPVCRIHGSGRDRLRLPCFFEERGCMVLPAFGEFTGGWEVSGAPGRRLYAVGGERVWRLPAST